MRVFGNLRPAAKVLGVGGVVVVVVVVVVVIVVDA